MTVMRMQSASTPLVASTVFATMAMLDLEQSAVSIDCYVLTDINQN